MGDKRSSLILRNVTVRRPDGIELYRLEERIFESGFIALTGPNGAGKSTLLKFLAGLDRNSSGSVSACGVDKDAAPARYAQQIAYQMQNFSGYPQTSGFQFMRYLLRLRGFGRENAAHLSAAGLENVGLADADVPLEAYSQGMLQRLGIAYVLQSGAPVALMDEPFSGVDPRGRMELLDLIARHAQERAFLICTHHVEELIERGAVRLEVGTASEQAAAR
jgi:ABC-2 type transport system ATP-binding protein